MDETLNLIVSFLGGGVVSALIGQLSSWRAAKKERKLKLLEEQIRELYGPLFYLVVQSEKLLSLSNRFLKAYHVEFVDKEYSESQLTRERVSSMAEATIGLANQYVKQVEVNNKRVSQLLDSKFSYIDPNDIELFLLFFEHHTRLTTERNEGGVLNTPYMIYSQVGEISYLRPEFIERVKGQFHRKKKELDKLSGRLF